MADVKLNVLYITTDCLYIHHELELIKVEQNRTTVFKIPMHHVQGIVIMALSNISPSLLQKCLQKGIYVSFLTPRGRFLGRLEGSNSGNVLLRKKQFRMDDGEKIEISKSIIAGKIQNQRLNLLRTAREINDPEKERQLREIAGKLADAVQSLEVQESIESIRGIEGVCSKNYFSVIDHCIFSQKEDFNFDRRTKRPPRSRLNTVLSFAYSILTNDCLSALQSVGLDPFIGIHHVERPGRPSLALDLVEEFRPFAERFVMTLINRKQIQKKDLEEKAGSVYNLTNEGRKSFLTNYQNRKQESITHHYLEQKCTVGELILLQARLLARSIRDPKESYIPYIWR